MGVKTDLENKLIRKKKQYKRLVNTSLIFTGIYIVFSIWYIFYSLSGNVNHLIVGNIFYFGIVGIFMMTIFRIKLNYELFMIASDIKYQELLEDLNKLQDKIKESKTKIIWNQEK